MTRPKIDDEFTLFESWLKEERGLTPKTSRSYASTVRSAKTRLLQNGNLTKDNVDAFFQAKYHQNPYTCSHTRSAWSAYAKYQEVMGEKPVPLPAPANQVKKKEEVVPLPANLRDHLRTFRAAGLTYQNLSELCWNEVNLSEMAQKDRCAIRDKNKKHEYWLVPSKTVRAFFDWSQPGNCLLNPVIARSPGSDQPYPAYKLAKEAKTYTDAQLAELMEQADAQVDRPQKAALPESEHTDAECAGPVADPSTFDDPLEAFLQPLAEDSD